MIEDIELNEIKKDMDFVFQTIDDWLSESNFAACDSLLHSAHPDDLHPALIVAVLTITFAAKNKLPARYKFFRESAASLKRRIGKYESRRSLIGLE